MKYLGSAGNFQPDINDTADFVDALSLQCLDTVGW